MSKIWVNPWNFDKKFAVVNVFLREMASEKFYNYRISQTTPKYTISENLVRICHVVSENQRWIKAKRTHQRESLRRWRVRV